MAAQDGTWVVVAQVDEIKPGETRKFLLSCRGQEMEAFVVNHHGALHAYVNRCRHVPMTMDWVDNQFFTEDGAFIQCATHGACYRPETGECVEGPPAGKFLERVPLTIQDGAVLAGCPDADVPQDLSRPRFCIS